MDARPSPLPGKRQEDGALGSPWSREARQLFRHATWLPMVTAVLLCATTSPAQNLTVQSGDTLTLGGVHRYDAVRVESGGTIAVPKFDGSDRINTGNLQIVADSIVVEAGGQIIADASGYQPATCDDGAGPTAAGGGKGGCAVFDSGGGGAHFGMGGRGTKDCFCLGSETGSNVICTFPQEFEEACGQKDPNADACIRTDAPDEDFGCCKSPCSAGGTPELLGPGYCYNNDGLPSVAGQAYTHSVYEVEFGAAGGDKGCRDGWDTCLTAGAGGGRIVLAALDAAAGSLDIQGRVSAEGQSGCGHGNDSAGGGAGGTLLLVGDQVSVGANAYVSAAGGLGGNTQGVGRCAQGGTCYQKSGTCDDCGGGGGGGIISVLSGQAAQLAGGAQFNVAGAEGGVCEQCKGESGGGAGELQLNGLYSGEFCDGHDNNFDGQVDENLGDVSCGTGACQATVSLCNTSDPNDIFTNDCIPDPIKDCQPPLTDTRSRFMVITDTSGSMLTDLTGIPTFGDGSNDHLGIDTNGDGLTNDSRLYKAKRALTQVISAYPEIDFGLARFSQGVGQQVSCQLASWFECADLCCSYDDPADNSGAIACQKTFGSAGAIDIRANSGAEACINYAGRCGPPHRGADVLVGFDRPILQKLGWLDQSEQSFNASTTEGDHCSYSSGGDCELRGTGPTPLAGSLLAVRGYLAQTAALDRIASCRRYAVILLTDGAETCEGDPAAAATALLALGVETFVIGFSVLTEEQDQLNAIAQAGSAPGQTRNAFFVGDEAGLAAALAKIVADSIVFEKCNDLDDDCDELVDEDFPNKGRPCDNGQLGECFRSGTWVCDGVGLVCDAPQIIPGNEVCDDQKDNNCNGLIDEGCGSCIPQIEICNGRDEDCDDVDDNDIASADCGILKGNCRPGKTACEDGEVVCKGAVLPAQEICDGEDNDCDGVVDHITRSCYPFERGCDSEAGSCTGQCRFGTELCTAASWGDCVGAVGPADEICDGVDNDCDGKADDFAECPAGSLCVEGQCAARCDQGEFPCSFGFLCDDGWCVPDPCDRAACAQQGKLCRDGECIDPCEGIICGGLEECQLGRCVDVSCYSKGCPSGERCVLGNCEADPCFDKACAHDEFCVDGSCTKLCEALQCPSGTVCQVVDEGGRRQTKCVEDPCAKIVCETNHECVNGECVIEPCSGVKCELGERCVKGQCVVDLCELTTCPLGYTCRDGECRSEGERQELLATGSGGFSCAVGKTPHRPAPLALILGLLWILRLRRRNRARRRAVHGGLSQTPAPEEHSVSGAPPPMSARSRAPRERFVALAARRLSRRSYARGAKRSDRLQRR